MIHGDMTIAGFWSSWVGWWCSLSAEARLMALDSLEREQALTNSAPAIGVARAALLASFFQPHGG